MPNVYVDKDMNIVPAGDARAARLAWREGGTVDETRLEAMKRGLSKEVKAAIAAQKAAVPVAKEPTREAPEEVAEPEEKAVDTVENKAVEQPAENKSARGRVPR